jgi:hypothetical protein
LIKTIINNGQITTASDAGQPLTGECFDTSGGCASRHVWTRTFVSGGMDFLVATQRQYHRATNIGTGDVTGSPVISGQVRTALLEWRR